MRALPIALLASLTLASPAQADYDPLASGTTRLSFEKPFLSFLRQHGVRLKAKAPAKLKAGVLTLPVSGGEMDPLIGKGTVEAQGALLFVAGKHVLPFKRLTVKTKKAPLQAKVGGNQLKIAQGARIAASRNGFGTTFTATGLELSAKVASRLNKKLRLGDAFSEGQTIGTLKAKTQPLTTTILAEGRATLVPDPGFIAKLDALFVSLNPIFPAERAPGPIFSFPIVLGGELAPEASQGTLRTGGSLEFLQQGAGQLFQHEFWTDLGAQATSAEVDVEPTPTYPGKLGRIGVYGLNLAAAGVSSDPEARTIAVSNAPLTLDAQTAATFDEVFAEGKGVFRAGDPFGVLSFAAQGQ